MISLVKLILNEGQELAPISNNLPKVNTGVNVDLNNFKRVLAEALNIEESEVEVGIVPAKSQDANQIVQAMMDRMDPGKTGDIWAKFGISLGTDELAQKLNEYRILDEIEVNGQSGYELSGIVSDGTRLAGNLVVTTKNTELELIPFLRAIGAIEQANDDGGFENYWDKIGGRIIGEATIQRMQQNLLAAAGIRNGRQLGGFNPRMLGR